MMTASRPCFQRLSLRRWLPLALVLVACLPRLCAVGRYVTPDELAWVYRSVQLREALLDGRWADTLVSGHPGVTTTGLGALGITAQLVLHPADHAAYDWITHVAWLAPDNMAAFQHLAAFLTAGRVAVALVSSVGVALVYVLARRLWGHRVALLGATLLALDPFFTGLTGLLHVDGLAAIFAILALLALALALGRSARFPPHAFRWSAASGGFAALAVLSKSPAITLLPFSGLALLIYHLGPPLRPLPGSVRWRRLLWACLAWASGFCLVSVVMLPALWAAPLDSVRTIVGMVDRHTGEALRTVYFMGRGTLDPGAAFYPVALAFRLGAPVFVGLGLAVVLLVRGNQRLRSSAALLLWVWVPLFVVVITLGGKKFDRYSLPAVPALVLLGALAWDTLAGRARRWFAWILVSTQVVLLLSVLPYPLSAFNPLLGGSSVAERVLPVGWGEEVGAAGRWLARQPEAASATAMATVAPSLAPFFPGQTLLLDESRLASADYLVLTAGSRQLDPLGFQQLSADARLVHTIRYSGLDQAWIYVRSTTATPPPVLTDIPAPPSFDHRVQLRALSLEATADRVLIHARWSLLQPGGRYTVQLTLRDQWQHDWSSLEVPLLNSTYFYPDDWAPGEIAEVQYALDLPPAIAPADYVVALTLFDAVTGARLPLILADGRFAGVIFSSDPVVVPAPAEPVDPVRVAIQSPQGQEWLDGAIALLGSSAIPLSLPAGELAMVTLIWQASAPLPADMEVQFQLSDQVQVCFPLSRYPSGSWRTGEVIQERYSIPIPPKLAPGRYLLRLAPITAGTPAPSTPADLGSIEVVATERLFELPPDIPIPLAVDAGDAIQLRGATLPMSEAHAPGQLALTLYWQALRQPDADYTTFVHLVALDDGVPAQADRWPANLPSHTWAPGQVIIDDVSIDIPADTPLGTYRLAVGLYQAASGLRLPLTGADGTQLMDDRFFLPVTVEVVAP